MPCRWPLILRSCCTAAVMLVVGTAGCAARPRQAALPTTMPSGLLAPAYASDLEARVVPPQGWQVEPVKQSARHRHQVWVSPTGRTAYGVIHFSLPFPVGHELLLWAFLREMRNSEGEAELLSKRWDSNQRLLRFVAQGGLYTVRTNLLIDGFDGWAVYAGSLTAEPVEPLELKLAERAREHTRVGVESAEMPE